MTKFIQKSSNTQKILTNTNVVDPGFNILAAIIFLIPYFFILFNLLEFTFATKKDYVLFIALIHFFPAASCFAIGAVLEKETRAIKINTAGCVLLTISILAMILLGISIHYQ